MRSMTRERIRFQERRIKQMERIIRRMLSESEELIRVNGKLRERLYELAAKGGKGA